MLVSAQTEVKYNFFPNKLAELRLCEVFVFGTHPIDDEKKKIKRSWESNQQPFILMRVVYSCAATAAQISWK